MTTPTLPLEAIAQRINQRQAELDALRRDYEARQAQLAKLNRRKEELQVQLAQIERDITAVSRGQVPAPTPAPVSAGKPKVKPTAPPAVAPSLTQFLIDFVRQAAQPVTVKQLVEEVTRRKLPTKSSNIRAVIKSRVQELVRRGVLRRAKDQPGILPGDATAAAKPAVHADGNTGSSRPGKAKPTAKAARRSPTKPDAPQPSLPALLTRLLQKSERPLDGNELARQAQAAGYRTKSKNFANVIYVRLGQMANVERLPGKGYRLKKR